MSIGFGDLVNWYLGKRYEPLMKCVNHGGKFTAYELGIPGMTMKGLADDGYLKLVEKRCTYPERPNLYVVTEKVCQHFLDG